MTSQDTDVLTPAPTKLQIYESEYFDDSRYGGKPQENTIYYAVNISNITEDSFDFSVTENMFSTNAPCNTLLPLSTAYFVEDGTQAVFQEGVYNLTFHFPDNHLSHPVITDLEIDGLARVNGITFVNNDIPGCGFG